MLEVLLWTPFVLSDPGSQTSEPDRVCGGSEDVMLSLGEANGGLPERYKVDTLKLASRPLATRTVWREVVRSQLDEDDLKQAVLGCLDENFQSAEEVVNKVTQAIAARE